MSRAPSPARHVEAAKARLCHLAGIAARTRDAEQSIHDIAEKRLAAVEASLTQLRPRAISDREAGDQYQSLMLERGQLQVVISQARTHLGA
jgi:hypothetical protein